MTAPASAAGRPLWQIGFTCPVSVCYFAIKELGVPTKCREMNGGGSVYIL